MYLLSFSSESRPARPFLCRRAKPRRIGLFTWEYSFDLEFKVVQFGAKVSTNFCSARDQDPCHLICTTIFVKA